MEKSPECLRLPCVRAASSCQGPPGGLFMAKHKRDPHLAAWRAGSLSGLRSAWAQAAESASAYHAPMLLAPDSCPPGARPTVHGPSCHPHSPDSSRPHLPSGVKALKVQGDGAREGLVGQGRLRLQAASRPLPGPQRPGCRAVRSNVVAVRGRGRVPSGVRQLGAAGRRTPQQQQQHIGQAGLACLLQVMGVGGSAWGGGGGGYGCASERACSHAGFLLSERRELSEILSAARDGGRAGRDK
jgi:hypothetical protein